jgi:hypothetical protein
MTSLSESDVQMIIVALVLMGETAVANEREEDAIQIADLVARLVNLLTSRSAPTTEEESTWVM